MTLWLAHTWPHAQNRAHRAALQALLTARSSAVAAVVLTAWSHPGRCRSDAAFAMLAGAAPIPSWSGKTVRHRLIRSGNRQLNRALHSIALSRLRFADHTRGYAETRRAQGKTDREIKRYIARHLYRQLENPLASHSRTT